MTWLKRGITLILLLTILVCFTAWWWLRGSQPELDGVHRTPGLLAPVTLRRDAQGILELESTRRDAIAFGLGFAHAQDRFFQMDLQRRSAAGELAALFGPRAVGTDQSRRVHRFRSRAERNLAQASPGMQILLHAYARGVNAGLNALDRPPFEYTLLGATPEPWQAADAYLTLFSMILVLQQDDGGRERARGLMAEVLPPDVLAFFTPAGGAWDAPLFGAPLANAPVPETPLGSLWQPGDDDRVLASADRFDLAQGEQAPGSNNWAMAGRFTEHGAALVANDMHLPLGIPNTWYRAQWRDPQHGRLVSGGTLPGQPFMVVGSNERIAWGFTNSEGDWSDVIILDVEESGERYRTAQGWVRFERHEELIFVKDELAKPLLVKETIWGPVIGSNHDGALLALRWTAHDPAGANFHLSRLEHDNNVLTPLGQGYRMGMPQVNLVLADADGNIGWTIAGPIPRRSGTDGVTPAAWTGPNQGWLGYHDNETHPRLYNPVDGRLWTANARVVSGRLGTILGDDALALGARQQQIRDRLFDLEQADEEDMLALQLDNEARFLGRWHQRMLNLLPAGNGNPAQAAARAALENWSGRAAADDVGYRLVRDFRSAALERVLEPVNLLMREHDPGFNLYRVNRQLEYPGWQLITERPAHWLNPKFASWEALELDALEATLAPLYADGTLGDDSWGEANRLSMDHPLASSIPLLGGWLRLPDTPMSGDTHMPWVQFAGFGASQRYAISPGREAEAYFHMPAGQSAHPLSPFFTAGHEDWLNGKASPWLAGPAVHELRLLPPDADD